MWSLQNAWGPGGGGAIRSAGNLGHPGLIAPLITIAARTLDPEIALDIANALEQLTGERVGGDFILTAPSYHQWMGEQEDLPLLPGFAQWKGALYANTDPVFADFFYEGVPPRIPLWAAQSGGAKKDGIPHLHNPHVIPADLAEYLEPDEPVFGVFVNSEARAYPHRIMGWHELANDIAGGKPISLIY